MMETTLSSETPVLQESHGLTSQKTAFFNSSVLLIFLLPLYTHITGSILRFCLPLQVATPRLTDHSYKVSYHICEIYFILLIKKWDRARRLNHNRNEDQNLNVLHKFVRK
jgi:hypothetical protein